MCGTDLESLVVNLTHYVMKNRKHKAFQGWTALEILNTLRDAAFNKAMVYFENKEGLIVGVCHGIPDHTKKIFHVSNILTTEVGVIKQFIIAFQLLFPGYTLSGTRYGKLKSYNTPRLLSKGTLTTKFAKPSTFNPHVRN